MFESFSGRWIFSDRSNSWAWQSNRKFVRHTCDTLETPIPTFLKDLNLNTLIISRHSGLRTFEDILVSQILQHYQPVNLIYDPGTNNGDINQHIKEIPQFSEIGYKLNKIVVLPHLQHQYCEYEFKLK